MTHTHPMICGELVVDEYLRPTRFIDCHHPDVIAFARRVTEGKATAIDKAVALFYAVRDEIRYDPYRIDLAPEAMRASAALARGYAFCIPKAALLAAAARVLGIPSRLGFADVRNHLTTERLRAAMGTDVFVFHGYTSLYLDRVWVKATPAFNATLCERFDVAPLAFDGRKDAMLQQADRRGRRYLEYLRDRGEYPDVPLDAMLAAFTEAYPALMVDGAYRLEGEFEDEANHAARG